MKKSIEKKRDREKKVISEMVSPFPAKLKQTIGATLFMLRK